MPTAAQESQLEIEVDGVHLPGTARIPASAAGMVIFAHGSGSSRMSPRNVAVAHALEERGLATFLFDLLDPREAQDRRNVFDIELLARRMVAATHQLQQWNGLRNVPLGYFGASTGAAAALVAAAHLARSTKAGPQSRPLHSHSSSSPDEVVAAVVSRGGRPDLAGQFLAMVTAPTLLLVGSLDVEVIELNHQAQAMMRCETKLSIIRGASHLFEEPGTLEQVAREAGDWFIKHFARQLHESGLKR